MFVSNTSNGVFRPSTVILKRRVLARQYVFVETLAVMEVNMQTS